MEPYYVGGYLPFEYWSDAAKGPELVGKLSTILREEGFSVLYNDTDEASNVCSDVECLWYRLIFIPMLEDEKRRTEWYGPKFTDEQKDIIALEIEQA